MKSKILKYILNHYLKSRDCNGCSVPTLIRKYKDIVLIKQTLIELLREGSINLYYCNTNPFIKNFDLKIPLDKQISIITDLPDEYKPVIIEKIKTKKMSPLIIYGDDDFSPVSLYPSVDLIEKATNNKKKYLEVI
ncbi:MAG: hypothetical protein WCG23_10185 [bacterium]